MSFRSNVWSSSTLLQGMAKVSCQATTLLAKPEPGDDDELRRELQAAGVDGC